MQIQRVVFLLLFCFLTIKSSGVYAKDFEQDFSKWVSYYYLQPEKEKIPSAVLEYAQSKLFSDINSRYITATFFASVCKDNPSLIDELFKAVNEKGDDKSKILFLNIAWQMQNKESLYYFKLAEDLWLTVDVQKALEWLSENPPLDLLTDPILEPKHIDMIWAYFYATGDKKAILRIIDILHLFRDGQKKEIAIGAAAQWSLGLQAQSHKMVYHVCKNELYKTEGLTQKILEEIVSSIEP